MKTKPTIYLQHGPKSYVKIVALCPNRWNLGNIETLKPDGCINVVEDPKYSSGLRTLSPAFQEAFRAHPDYTKSQNGESRRVGDRGYKGSIITGSFEEAQKFLEGFFNVVVCKRPKRRARTLEQVPRSPLPPISSHAADAPQHNAGHFSQMYCSAGGIGPFASRSQQNYHTR